MLRQPERRLTMHRTHSRIAAAAVVALAGAFAAGCGQAGQPSPASAYTAEPVSASSPGSANSDWAQRASTICENALPDDSHQLVNHFDARHIKRHGMAIVDAGSKLDALGAPPGGDAGAYGRMIELYKRSVIYHGLALRDLAKGNDGNAAAEYAIGLDLANKADGLAMGFGAESCDRFGMGG
jgi:hypothetical protein